MKNVRTPQGGFFLTHTVHVGITFVISWHFASKNCRLSFQLILTMLDVSMINDHEWPYCYDNVAVVCVVFIGRCVDGCSGHGWCLTEHTCKSVTTI